MAAPEKKKPTTTTTHAAAPMSEVKIDPRDTEFREREASMKRPDPAAEVRFKGVGVFCPILAGKYFDVIFHQGAFATSDPVLIEWCRTKFEEIVPEEKAAE